MNFFFGEDRHACIVPVVTRVVQRSAAGSVHFVGLRRNGPSIKWKQSPKVKLKKFAVAQHAYPQRESSALDGQRSRRDSKGRGGCVSTINKINVGSEGGLVVEATVPVLSRSTVEVHLRNHILLPCVQRCAQLCP